MDFSSSAHCLFIQARPPVDNPGSLGIVEVIQYRVLKRCDLLLWPLLTQLETAQCAEGLRRVSTHHRLTRGRCW
jgi:cell division inhibitor SulA